MVRGRGEYEGLCELDWRIRQRCLLRFVGIDCTVRIRIRMEGRGRRLGLGLLLMGRCSGAWQGMMGYRRVDVVICLLGWVDREVVYLICLVCILFRQSAA
jgi:hypothetical protein